MKINELFGNSKIDWTALRNAGAVQPMLYYPGGIDDKTGKRVPPNVNQPNIITAVNLKQKLGPGEKLVPLSTRSMTDDQWQDYMDEWWAKAKNDPDLKYKIDQIKQSAREKNVEFNEWMVMPHTADPMGLIHKAGTGPNDRYDFKNKGNNRANETLEDKFQSALNADPVQPKREWTAFEMACMEGGHPLPEDTVNEKCWDGYKQVGMKNKGGRQVPNCVPEDAAGVGTITKQNTTADVKPGDEYKNVKKLHLEFKQFIAEAQQYKGAIFLNDRTAIVGQAHKQTPELSPETLKRVQDIATKYGAYSEGNGADEPYTKAIGITNYKGSWDDLFAGSISGYPWQFIYSIMANVNDNRTWDQIGEDPNKTIFNQILASQQNHNFFTGKRYEGQTLLKFLEEISEGNNNFVEMAKLPATKKNVYEFLKKGESLMFPSNWQSYPYKAGRVAKAANDARDKFLAKRTQGAYFVGDGHLLNIQTLANKKIEENFADGKVKGKSRPGRVKRAGASCKGSVSSLRSKAKKYSGERGKMYHWCANMKSGRSKK